MAGDKRGANKRKKVANARAAAASAAVQNSAAQPAPPAPAIPPQPSNAAPPAVVLGPLSRKYRRDALLLLRHEMKDEPLEIAGGHNPSQPHWRNVTIKKICKASRSLQQCVIEGYTPGDAEVFYNPQKRDGLPVMEHLTDMAVNMDRARKDRNFGGPLGLTAVEWFDDMQAMSEPEFWWGLCVFLDWMHSGNAVRGERFVSKSFGKRFTAKERVNLVTIGDFLQAEDFLDAVLDLKEKGDVAESQDFEETEDEVGEAEEHRKGLEQIQSVLEDAIDEAITIIGESLTSANTTKLAQFVLKYAM